MKRRLLLGGGGLAPWVHVRAATVQQVVYPASESPQDRRFDDMVDLLRQVLQRTEAGFGPFEMRPHTEYLTQPRQIMELQQGRILSLQWSATTLEKEQLLRPVRIPTRRGLLGFRLMLIRRERQAEFRRIRTLDDLRRYRLGSGSTWIDTEILRSQALRVETGSYESLFKMLAMGRFDLFPRGLNEAFTEQEVRQADFPDLAVEESLALYYPMPYYFFVNRADAPLATRLEAGLVQMLRDGSFDEHFKRHHGVALQKARLRERQIIRLTNPLLPPETPLHRAELWWSEEPKKP